MASLKTRALQAIDREGILLVFPIQNQKVPASLWSALWPRSRMRWEWTDDADNRVAELWHLREGLSKSAKVVYGKWFRGRATFFSRKVFASLLASLHGNRSPRAGLSPLAREILDLLEMNSPISTKRLKKELGLRGKRFSADFDRAMKELWARLLIVGFGEVDDGAFPSLAVGATQLLFEDIWTQALSANADEAQQSLRPLIEIDSPFSKSYWRLKKDLARAREAAKF